MLQLNTHTHTEGGREDLSMYTQFAGLPIKVVVATMCDSTSTCTYTPTKKPTQAEARYAL